MKTKFLTLIVAVAMLAACKGKGKSAEADSARGSSVELKRVLVKTADINFKVKNVLKTGEAIAVLTDQYNGMVMHHQTQSEMKASENIRLSNDSIMLVSAYNTTADMTVKIPSEKLENFINQVSHLGIYINSSKMDIEDRSLGYLSSKLKTENREELVAQQKSGKVTLKHPQDILSVKDDIVDKQISNLKTDEDATYSTITLNFYQTDTINKEVVANNDPSAYNIPVIKRLGLALANGWFVFMDLVVAMANLWMFILLGIGVWFGVIFYRKRVRLTKTRTA